MLEKRKRTCYYVLLFFANAVGMVLELAASRVMSPYFGTTNYVWTAIIGIILLSGSVGNLAGGRVSKREDRRRVLVWLLAIAAAVTAGISVLGPAVLTALRTSGADIRITSVAASIALFFIPSAILGTVTPVLMNDMLAGLEGDTGNESGKIHAVIAVGSLAGTFAGGFWLIPAFGTRVILNLLALALLLLTLLLLADWNKWSAAAVLVCAAVAALCFVSVERTQAAEKTGVAEVSAEALRFEADFEKGVNIDTQYGRIVIQDSVAGGYPIRSYRTSGAYESITFLDEDLKYELYHPVMAQYNRIFEYADVRDTLMIGGAAYQYPEYYISHYKDKAMDVVEIDPMSTEIAKKYFFLDDLIRDFRLKATGRLGLITADGRIYLNETEKTYDAILNDAFSGETPVATLATVEAATRVREHLNPGGVYMSNIVGALDREQDRFLNSELATLNTVFPYVYVVPGVPGDDGSRFSNYMTIASDRPLDVPDALPYAQAEEDIVFTDDYCPVEHMYAP